MEGSRNREADSRDQYANCRYTKHSVKPQALEIEVLFTEQEVTTSTERGKRNMAENMASHAAKLPLSIREMRAKNDIGHHDYSDVGYPSEKQYWG